MTVPSAVIFGGTKGLGAAIASRFLQNGMKVAVMSRNDTKVRAVISKLNGGEMLYGMTCDVTDDTAVKNALKRTVEQLGPMSVLVNAAGINIDNLLLKTTTENIQSIINCNLIGTMITCRAALKYMLPLKQGCIINIGSVVGSRGNAGQTVYSASKAGLEGFTKSLAKEMAPRNIRVNLIAPGFIETDMTKELKDHTKIVSSIPLRRMGTPADVAHLANFLLDAQYITGQVLFVDGGLNICF